MSKQIFDKRSLRRCLAAAFIAAVGLLSVSGALANPMPGESGIGTVEVSSQPSIKVVDGHVEINLPGDDPRQVAVYSLTGQLVKSLTVHPGVTVIDLAPGYYIVRCDRLSQRVIVR